MAKDPNKEENTKKLMVKKTEALKQIEFIRKIFDENPVGAPRHYNNAEDLQKRMIEYFVYCAEEKINLTISGLVLFCGFSDRKSFYEYEKNPTFTHAIKTAREIMVQYYENKGANDAFPTFAIFALKNLGWTAEETLKIDKTEKTEFWVGGDPDAPEENNLLNDQNREYYDYEETD